MRTLTTPGHNRIPESITPINNISVALGEGLMKMGTDAVATWIAFYKKIECVSQGEFLYSYGRGNWSRWRWETRLVRLKEKENTYADEV